MLLVLLSVSFSELERKYLQNPVQLTHEGENGEAYFSPDGNYIAFQGIPPGKYHYRIYIMRSDGSDRKRISPGKGKTTCAFFHPDFPKVPYLMYASTHEDTSTWREEPKKGHGYAWSFDHGMDIYLADTTGRIVEKLISHPGYDAEGSFCPSDPNLMVWTSQRTGDLEIWVKNLKTGEERQITHSPGYDGGPFFSPDCSKIIYRSFRDPKNPRVAEIYIYDLKTGEERQMTHLKALSWAPYFHPSGRYFIFSSNYDPKTGKMGRRFHLFVMDTSGKHLVRITDTREGSDLLPTFSWDGRYILWTSTRTGNSQIWKARWREPEF
ncbi:MAG: hypothetical protein GXO29_03110 [Thermotogae bacterium]|nr:hypothetical protein [Thermotogota bacterium]